MAQNREKSTMRSLGEFFGHIMRGVRTDPERALGRRVIPGKTFTEVETRETPAGRVVLRRTIVEEVVLPPAPTAQQRGH